MNRCINVKAMQEDRDIVNTKTGTARTKSNESKCGGSMVKPCLEFEAEFITELMLPQSRYFLRP